MLALVMLRKEATLAVLRDPLYHKYFACTPLPCISVMLLVTHSFSGSSCFLNFPTENVGLCSLSLPPFSLSTVACSWFDGCLLHLFLPSSQAFTWKFLYVVRGGSGTCQLTPGLISMLCGTTSRPVNILLAAHPDMHNSKSFSLPGNRQSRNDFGHSQNNTQSSQE